MAEPIRNVMSRDPATVDAAANLVEAGRAMRDAAVGDVLVLDGGKIAGIVTDRDIVVRAVAEGRDPTTVTVGSISTRNVTTLSPDDPIDRALRIMREQAIRRLPVVENGRPVGIVSLGDLAVDRDPESALADISAAPPNN
jgi:CBS domain-containing protein